MRIFSTKRLQSTEKSPRLDVHLFIHLFCHSLQNHPYEEAKSSQSTSPSNDLVHSHRGTCLPKLIISHHVNKDLQMQ